MKRTKRENTKATARWRKRFERALIMVGVALLCVAGVGRGIPVNAVAEDDCPDVRFVFARGSGGTRWEDKNYLAWKNGIEEKIGGSGLEYEFIDLDYPAIGIGEVNTLVSTFFSAGNAYEFSASVNAGVRELVQMVNGECTNTKYVLGGYSQGAMVVSKAIHSIPADRIIYVATFGDPKIYLPEGRSQISVSEMLGGVKNVTKIGMIPAACKGENLSDYRMYVPDCYAYKGMLGAYEPYEPIGYAGKLGTWCNTYDFFCSSYLSTESHSSYVADNLYEDAARVIYNKVAEEFGLAQEYVSPHDTAIMIDATGSMSGLIERYRNEALNLTKKTLEGGGRVALYTYGDRFAGQEITKLCGFDECGLAEFNEKLQNITVDGGGDANESVLWSSRELMQELEWKRGATKSVVVLTDAGYHVDDYEGVTIEDVVKLSKAIDPVNFYVITPSEIKREYEELTTLTDGAVVDSSSELSALTETIIRRYDSLPRVVETGIGGEGYEGLFGGGEDFMLPDIDDVTINDDGENVLLKWSGTATSVMVAVNDAVLGVSGEHEINIQGLDRFASNIITLAPLSETRRGESTEIELSALYDGYGDAERLGEDTEQAIEVVIPKAPNTGAR